MLTIALGALFVAVALISLISLADSAIKWRNTYRAMKADRAFTGYANTKPANDCAVVLLRPALGRRQEFIQRAASAPFAAAA